MSLQLTKSFFVLYPEIKTVNKPLLHQAATHSARTATEDDPDLDFTDRYIAVKISSEES